MHSGAVIPFLKRKESGASHCFFYTALSRTGLELRINQPRPCRGRTLRVFSQCKEKRIAFQDNDLPTALRRDSCRQVTAYRSGDTPEQLRTRYANVREADRVKESSDLG